MAFAATDLHMPEEFSIFVAFHEGSEEAKALLTELHQALRRSETKMAEIE